MYVLLNKLIFLVLCLVFGVMSKLDFKYHTNEGLENVLKQFEISGKEKLMTRLYSIGNSSNKNDPFPLWVLELTAVPENKFGVPNVKLLGNIHGNEPGGREVLLHFIEYLIDQYQVNENVTWLLNNTRIHILPTINPDGFKEAGNACESKKGENVPSLNVDLNRIFPDYYHKNLLPCTEECQAVIKWMQETKFILSAAIYGGDMVASYPYDEKSPNGEGEYLTPDDDVFKYLARTYANNHPVMHHSCPGRHFKGGITNGADLEQFDGGMGDYNYNFHGCMEVTLKLSCCVYPPDLKLLWEQNKKSLLQYCMQAHRGVTGRVLDFVTEKPIEANLTIVGRNMPFRSLKKTGEFWRILLPGEYTLQVEANGYLTHWEPFEVLSFSKFPELTNVSILLKNTSIFTNKSTTIITSSTTTKRVELDEILIIPDIATRFDAEENNDRDYVPITGELKSGYAVNNVNVILLHIITFLVVIG